MRQTVLTIATEVQPGSVVALRSCIERFRAGVQGATGGSHADGYDAFGASIPSLHFASIMIFEDERYDPLLTVELNFDGEAGPFLPRLEASSLKGVLRDMVRCCKPPRGAAAALYKAVTDPDSKLPIAPYLETCIVRPAVFHQGNRGFDRGRIGREAALFEHAQRALAEPAFAAPSDAASLHHALRRALRSHHPWLDEPEPQRWTAVERLEDAVRLAGFVMLVLFCLSLPGMVLDLLMPTWAVLAIAVIGTLAFAGLIRRISTPGTPEAPIPESPALPTVPTTPPERVALMGGIVVAALALHLVVVGAVLTLPLLPFHHHLPSVLFRAATGVALVGLATVPLPVAGLIHWLRRLEICDETQENPKSDPGLLRRIAALEDQVAQNHMGSVVLVKPGLLRAVLLRVGLRGLGLLLRLTQTDGYLGSMRTIHFAHWAILSNGGRLAFFSNFDSSWESYLDDFIEKAHLGLTLAWTNGVGFPPTRFLVGQGATNGRLFKAWARHSMAESLFWYSAYKDLSVNQIERQAAVASGLRRPSLTPEEAETWARNL